MSSTPLVPARAVTCRSPLCLQGYRRSFVPALTGPYRPFLANLADNLADTPRHSETALQPVDHRSAWQRGRSVRPPPGGRASPDAYLAHRSRDPLSRRLYNGASTQAERGSLAPVFQPRERIGLPIGPSPISRIRRTWPPASAPRRLPGRPIRRKAVIGAAAVPPLNSMWTTI